MKFTDKDIRLLSKEMTTVLQNFDDQELGELIHSFLDRNSLIEVILDAMSPEEMIEQIMVVSDLEGEVTEGELMEALQDGYLDELIKRRAK